MKLTDFFRPTRRQVLAGLNVKIPKSPPKISKAHKKIVRKWGKGKTNQADHNLAQEVSIHWKQGRLEELKDIKIRKTANFLFGSDKTFQALKADSKFVKAFLMIAVNRNRRGIWRALIRSYLAHYHPEDKVIKQVAKYLNRHRKKLPNDWLENTKQINLFDVQKNTPELVAGFVLKQQDRPISISLNDIKLSEAAFGMMKYVRREIAEKIKNEMIKGKKDHSEKFYQWITNDGNTIKEIFGEAALMGLIGPLLKNISLMSQKSEKLLLDSYGDPRFELDKWPRTEKEFDSYIDAFSRRLNAHTLEFFFKIISKTAAAEEDAARMWKAREKFWRENYLKKVKKALIICGLQAKRTFDLINDKEDYQLSCSRLTGGISNQSVLLMEIENMTVVEWSHKGGCRIWKTDRSNIPKFQIDNKYDARSLRGECDCRILHSKRNQWGTKQSWQNKIKSCLDNKNNMCP